jgi:hypothetical protein
LQSVQQATLALHAPISAYYPTLPALCQPDLPSPQGRAPRSALTARTAPAPASVGRRPQCRDTPASRAPWLPGGPGSAG